MNVLDKIKDQIVSAEITLIAALRKMDECRAKLLFVFEDDKFDCILTIGDIQRAIIRNVSMESPISGILVRDKIYASDKDSIEDIKKVMLDVNIDCMPVLNENNDIVNILYWADVFSNKVEDTREKIEFPVVIMAGGKGTRLNQSPTSFQSLLFLLATKLSLKRLWISLRALAPRSSTCLSTTRPT